MTQHERNQIDHLKTELTSACTAIRDAYAEIKRLQAEIGRIEDLENKLRLANQWIEEHEPIVKQVHAAQRVWPDGCPKRSSCARNRACVYGCKTHSGRLIGAEVDAAIAATSKPINQGDPS
jgi:chromosome segregation ATPase